MQINIYEVKTFLKKYWIYFFLIGIVIGATVAHIEHKNM
jgi:hypothetical protein